MLSPLLLFLLPLFQRPVYLNGAPIAGRPLHRAAVVQPLATEEVCRVEVPPGSKPCGQSRAPSRLSRGAPIFRVQSFLGPLQFSLAACHRWGAGPARLSRTALPAPPNPPPCPLPQQTPPSSAAAASWAVLRRRPPAGHRSAGQCCAARSLAAVAGLWGGGGGRPALRGRRGGSFGPRCVAGRDWQREVHNDFLTISAAPFF